MTQAVKCTPSQTYLHTLIPTTHLPHQNQTMAYPNWPQTANLQPSSPPRDLNFTHSSIIRKQFRPVPEAFPIRSPVTSQDSDDSWSSSEWSASDDEEERLMEDGVRYTDGETVEYSSSGSSSETSTSRVPDLWRGFSWNGDRSPATPDEALPLKIQKPVVADVVPDLWDGFSWDGDVQGKCGSEDIALKSLKRKQVVPDLRSEFSRAAGQLEGNEAEGVSLRTQEPMELLRNPWIGSDDGSVDSSNTVVISSKTLDDELGNSTVQFPQYGYVQMVDDDVAFLNTLASVIPRMAGYVWGQ